MCNFISDVQMYFKNLINPNLPIRAVLYPGLKTVEDGDVDIDALIPAGFAIATWDTFPERQREMVLYSINNAIATNEDLRGPEEVLLGILNNSSGESTYYEEAVLLAIVVIATAQLSAKINTKLPEPLEPLLQEILVDDKYQEIAKYIL